MSIIPIRSFSGFLILTLVWGCNPAQAQDTPTIGRYTMSACRNSRGAAADQIYFITDRGRQGMFRADPGDKTSPDDSAMTLVTASGLRVKRIIDGRSLNVAWFGAIGNNSPDNWAAIQKGINYILSNDNAPRTLYFPSALYRISRPLLIAKFTGKGYQQASITLEGPAGSKDLSTGGAVIPQPLIILLLSAFS